jgi:hypothetical protein
MTPNVSVNPGSPLLSSKGAPRLYRALGATFHLEPLSPDDAESLAEVNDLVHAWIGHELAWSTHTSFPLIDRYQRTDLDYIPGYADALRPPPPAADREQRNIENILFAATFGDFTLLTSGGEEPTFASPWSYRFASEVRQDAPGEGLHSCAMLRVTVPVAYPLGEFYAQTTAIASKLKVRWGAAGFTYSAWESAAFNQVYSAIFAHCRRHVGYDTGQYAAYLEEWHAAVRTTSWLTFLGEEFARRVEAAGRPLASHGAVGVSRVGTSVLLQAGERPEEGDINRLQIPLAYIQADEMIRAVRASEGFDFRSPWDQATSEGWLRRFEKRTH